MPTIDDFAYIDPSSIVIQRDERQRRVVDTSGLVDSIRKNGLINPIVVTRERVLIAGERRLASCLELTLSSVPVRFFDTLTSLERSVIELEENLKRSDLHWRDEAVAIAKLHHCYLMTEPTWNLARTAEALSLQKSWLGKIIRVAQDINSPKIASASGMDSAYNLLFRQDARAADSAVSDIMEGVGGAFGETPQGGAEKPQQTPIDRPMPPLSNAGPAAVASQAPSQQVASVPHIPTPAPVVAPAVPPESIQTLSFLDWAPSYSGPKFNFIHCDFPYGIGAFDGSLGATGAGSSADMGEGGLAHAKSTLYDDSEEVYWTLLASFCANLDNFMSHSAHLMFWFSLQHYEKTLAYFAKHAPGLKFNPMPLIWVKSDNRGILPDAKRGPRQIYETCLMASREDRFIVRAKSNAYSSPSDKQYHHSTKPEPMLRYFMEMFVDETTTVFDPTCGGGSALRAAESLGAKRVLGLEIDPNHADNARLALRRFRLLASAPKAAASN